MGKKKLDKILEMYSSNKTFLNFLLDRAVDDEDVPLRDSDGPFKYRVPRNLLENTDDDTVRKYSLGLLYNTRDLYKEKSNYMLPLYRSGIKSANFVHYIDAITFLDAIGVEQLGVAIREFRKQVRPRRTTNYKYGSMYNRYKRQKKKTKKRTKTSTKKKKSKKSRKK